MSRKRQSLTFELKKSICEQIERNCKTQAELARDHGLSRTTINTIWSQREKYKTNSCNDKAKRMRKGNYEDIEEALMTWLVQARSLGATVTGPLLKEKASQFAEQLGQSEFKCSDGWLDRFKARNNVTFRIVSGEANDAPQATIEDWQKKLPVILADYDPCDIQRRRDCLVLSNASNKTFRFKGYSCHGGKNSKQRPTLMIGANMDGSEKLPILAIGKSAKPRCFLNVKKLPVTYRNNKKAWMTSSLFREWIEDLDNHFGKKKRRILLIIDNCSSHDPTLSTSLKNIDLKFLPPNCTSHLQPCDLGIIKNLKVFYRRPLLLDAIENNEVDNFHVDILQCFRWIRSVWENEVSQATIANCFRKAGFIKEKEVEATGDNSLETDEFAFRDLGNIFDRMRSLNFSVSCYVEDFVSADDIVYTTQMLSDDEIVRSVAKNDKDACYSCSDEDEEMPSSSISSSSPPPTSNEAKQAISTLQRYLESVGASDDLFASLSKVDSYVHHVPQKKQTLLTTFFKPN